MGAEGKKKTKKHKNQTWAKEGPQDPFKMVTNTVCLSVYQFYEM